jgi:hypothetical protein
VQNWNGARKPSPNCSCAAAPYRRNNQIVTPAAANW